VKDRFLMGLAIFTLVMFVIIGVKGIWVTLTAPTLSSRAQCELSCLRAGHPDYRYVLGECFCIRVVDGVEEVQP